MVATTSGVAEDAGARTRSGLWSKVAAEAVGTFALVLAGCGAIAVDAAFGGVIGHVGIALTFGLVVAVMIYACGHISGAHFNPAVTVAFAVAGHFPWRQVPAYVLGQCVAAVAAALVLGGLLGTAGALGATTSELPVAAALGVEAVISFLLMFVITAVATDHRAVAPMAGVAIGGTVAMCALFAGPLTGASMNPARSLGPAAAVGDLGGMWLYVLGPLVGASAGAITYRALRCARESAGDAGGCC